ncbi:helix-turn-helix transcriptional regulator [Halocynthiibacter namhaensis]|uniref:helix-turn-helix transcriptional regulator n=1 Tax=Halocynthiibacter namhaensis TaxID=1290553 RepID=UPI0005790E09|nr:LuxR family transcriptional regulator [Halocynthiibacter namhaensis]
MISGYLEKLTACQCLEDVWTLHQNKMSEYGFGRVMYGFTRYRNGASLGDQDDLLLLSNHDTAYLDVFFGEKLYYNAPMVRWSLENEGACSWSWMADQIKAGTFTESELKVVDFNRSFDVTAGYTISFKSVSYRERGGIALTGNPGVEQEEVDEIWAKHGQDLLVMNNVAHLKLINMPWTGQRRPLTHRQREVLEWVGEGKTMQDIACIMGLTPATVEKHLRLVRTALDVETTAQAVRKASVQKQIYLIDG